MSGLTTWERDELECAFWGCKKQGDVWIGQDEQGRSRYVCEPHLQHTADTDEGTAMYRSLKEARAAQLASLGPDTDKPDDR